MSLLDNWLPFISCMQGFTQGFSSPFITFTQGLSSPFITFTQRLPTSFFSFTQGLSSPFITFTQGLPTSFISFTQGLSSSFITFTQGLSSYFITFTQRPPLPIYLLPCAPGKPPSTFPTPPPGPKFKDREQWKRCCRDIHDKKKKWSNSF